MHCPADTTAFPPSTPAHQRINTTTCTPPPTPQFPTTTSPDDCPKYEEAPPVDKHARLMADLARETEWQEAQAAKRKAEQATLTRIVSILDLENRADHTRSIAAADSAAAREAAEMHHADSFQRNEHAAKTIEAQRRLETLADEAKIQAAMNKVTAHVHESMQLQTAQKQLDAHLAVSTILSCEVEPMVEHERRMRNIDQAIQHQVRTLELRQVELQMAKVESRYMLLRANDTKLTERVVAQVANSLRGR